MALPNLIRQMDLDDQMYLEALFERHKNDAAWVIDAGFTAISGRCGNEIFWGKVGDNVSPEVSDTETKTFIDMYEFYKHMNHLGVENVKPLLTLSDMHWYSKYSKEREAPAEQRKKISRDIKINKEKYIPRLYLSRRIKEDNNFIRELEISLQHEFSSLVRRKITNKYSNLKRSKNNKIEKHFNIYRKLGWIYLKGTIDDEIYYFLSTAPYRDNNIYTESDSIKNVAIEGGMGVSYNISNEIIGQLCGVISAGRIFHSLKLNKNKNKSITIHIFDKNDDIHIDLKLIRGMLGIDSIHNESIVIIIIKDGEKINLISSEYYEKNTVDLYSHDSFEKDLQSSTERLIKSHKLENCELAYL